MQDTASEHPREKPRQFNSHDVHSQSNRHLQIKQIESLRTFCMTRGSVHKTPVNKLSEYEKYIALWYPIN